MKLSRRDLEKMKKIFVILSQARKPPNLDDAWQERVMNHVCTLETPGMEKGFEEQFRRIAWHLVPASCLMILLLGLVLTTVDFFPEYEMARQFIEEPTGYLVTKILGV